MNLQGSHCVQAMFWWDWHSEVKISNDLWLKYGMDWT